MRLSPVLALTQILVVRVRGRIVTNVVSMVLVVAERRCDHILSSTAKHCFRTRGLPRLGEAFEVFLAANPNTPHNESSGGAHRPASALEIP